MVEEQFSLYGHTRKNVLLILLSFFFLPLDTFIAFCALLSHYVVPCPNLKRRDVTRQDASFKPKTILVTGVGMSKGLTLARLFYEAGHSVIGADFSAYACGRGSAALSKFHTLKKVDSKSGSSGYVSSLLDIVRSDDVDLWVSCSGVASAVEDGEAKEVIEGQTSCKAIQFDVATTETLHEKHTFIAHTKEIGLTVPDTHTITSPATAEKILLNAPGDRKYIMKPIGMDDANRGDMTLLPKASSEQTTNHLSTLNISEKSPWILQQFIKGPEYCTHSLVVRGQVKAFVACPSAELLMHYEALPPSSRLYQAMLHFTEEYAAKGGREFTGHLSFDFMIEQSQVDSQHRVLIGDGPTLYPIECNPRAHTAVVLFNDIPELANAYLSILDAPSHTKAEKDQEDSQSPILTPRRNDRYFWIGHDLVELIIQPIMSISLFQPNASINLLFQNVSTFFEHILYWRDGTFERWDPVPWLLLYHVFWPLQFRNALVSGKGWSRINVSTTKIFEC